MRVKHTGKTHSPLPLPLPPHCTIELGFPSLILFIFCFLPCSSFLFFLDFWKNFLDLIGGCLLLSFSKIISHRETEKRREEKRKFSFASIAKETHWRGDARPDSLAVRNTNVEYIFLQSDDALSAFSSSWGLSWLTPKESLVVWPCGLFFPCRRHWSRSKKNLNLISASLVYLYETSRFLH